MSIHDDATAAGEAASRKVYDDAFASMAAELTACSQHAEELRKEYEAHLAQPHYPPPTTPEPEPEAAPIWTDDFSDLSQWSGAYRGVHPKQGVRLPANVVCADNILTVHARPTPVSVIVDGQTIPAGAWTAGGIMCTYVIRPGRRLRLDVRVNKSQGTRAVPLLWPGKTSPPWPKGGELDFVEWGANLPDRQATEITNHYANDSGAHAQQKIDYGPHDFTVWSEIEVDWTDDFVVRVDGYQAAVFTDHVPTTPMQLGVQTAIAGGGWGATFEGKPRTEGWIQVHDARVYDLAA